MLVPIDKASNNIAVICKKYYVEVILKEVGVLGQASVMVEIIHDDLLVTDRLKLKAEEKNEILRSTGCGRCIKIPLVKELLLHQNFVPLNHCPEQFLVFLTSFIVKLKIFTSKQSFCQIITNFGY